QGNEDDIANAKREQTKHSEHRAACEDIAKETKGKREDTRKLCQHFNQTNKELDTSQRFGEQFFEFEVLTQMRASAQPGKTKHLANDHNDQRHRKSQVQISRGRTEPGRDRTSIIARQKMDE